MRHIQVSDTTNSFVSFLKRVCILMNLQQLSPRHKHAPNFDLSVLSSNISFSWAMQIKFEVAYGSSIISIIRLIVLYYYI